jgi:hypothetical protein
MFTMLRTVALQRESAYLDALLSSSRHLHSQRIVVLFSVAISRGALRFSASLRKPQGGRKTPNLPNLNHVSSQISNYP